MTKRRIGYALVLTLLVGVIASRRGGLWPPTPAAPPCLSCQAAVMAVSDEQSAPLKPTRDSICTDPVDGGPSERAQWDALMDCICAGPCAPKCDGAGDTCKAMKGPRGKWIAPSPPCHMCLQDTLSGCGNALTECADDGL